MKKGLRAAGLLLSISIILVLGYPLRNGKSIRDAAGDQIVQQVPYALDILAARHPLKVGLLRALLNDEGAVDKAAQEYVSTSIKREDSQVVDCYLVYYLVVFNKDLARKAIADGLEQQFGLV